jgi:hypothetical protein
VRAAEKLALALLLCGNAAAQPRTISARAGTIAYQQGKVYLDDKRVYGTFGLTPPLQIKDGQQLRVDNGRVEVLLGSGVYLRMLGTSSIRMQETQLSDTRVLIEGSAQIELAGMNKGAQLRVMCGDTITELKRDGGYRFDAPMGGGAGKLRVYSGEAEVEREGAMVKAKNGQALSLAAGLDVSKFDPKETDPLQTWAAQRMQRRADAEKRRMQARAMQAARRKAELDEPDDGDIAASRRKHQ